MAAVTAVWIASMKGFAQFGGRVVEIVFGSKLRAITVARVAIGVLVIAFVVLVTARGSLLALLAFTLLMGTSQGVITIVRGAVPLALFGAEGYGTVLGVLATPILIVNAVSPTLFAIIIGRWGWQIAQMVLVAIAAVAWIAVELMSRWYERRRKRSRRAVAE